MDASSTTADLPAWFGAAAWGALACVTLFYFVSCYLFEVLAQKLDQPRWMAWVPLANAYLMFRLIGWELWFWLLLGGYAAALVGVFLPPPLSIVAAIAMIPTVLAVLVIGIAYWPVLARRRGLSLGVGLLMVLPQFLLVPLQFVLPEWAQLVLSLLTSLVAFGAFLTIVFHDGRPDAPPHPIGYAVTACGLLVGVFVVLQLPAWIQSQGGLPEGFATARAGAAREDPGTSLRDRLAEAIGARAGAPDAAAARPAAFTGNEPEPHRVASVCPEGTREAGARAPEGRAWWCELETPAGWVRHGPARSWINEYRVGEEGEYDRGRRHGTWTRYWPTGIRRVQAGFREGAQHGWLHRWSQAGQHEQAVYYENGEPAQP